MAETVPEARERDDMGTAGRVKNQFMALVDDTELGRLDALRVVMRTSRAEINRRVLKGESLDLLERIQATRLVRLDVVAARTGQRRAEFVRALVSGRVKVPTLEELESMNLDTLQAELRETPAA